MQAGRSYPRTSRLFSGERETAASFIMCLDSAGSLWSAFPVSCRRPCAMVVPDTELICEIMLVAEGFRDAKLLARKFITLYSLCKELLSKQVGEIFYNSKCWIWKRSIHNNVYQPTPEHSDSWNHSIHLYLSKEWCMESNSLSILLCLLGPLWLGLACCQVCSGCGRGPEKKRQE